MTAQGDRDDVALVLSEGIRVTLQAINDCLERKQILPALVLLYTTIDVIGSLEHPRATGPTFKSWVATYMLPSGLPCSAVDLYAARCGVLHTLTINSDLRRQGKARAILYAYGPASAENLAWLMGLVDIKRKLNGDPPHDVITLHVSDLRDALVNGIEAYLGDLRSDPERREAVRARLDQVLANMPDITRP
jgi:hypothetical protein